MKHFGYNFKFGGKSQYHTKIDFLGTWIGFSGLFFAIISTSIEGHRALGNAIFLVIMCYGGYLLASTFRFCHYLFFIVTLGFAAVLGYTGFTELKKCESAFNIDVLERCTLFATECFVVASFLFGLSVVSGFLLFKNSKPIQA